MTSYKNLIDPHHQFSTLVTRYLWLDRLEHRILRAPRHRVHLYRGFDRTERPTVSLPSLNERIVASAALKVRLGEQAEICWRPQS